MRYHRSKLIFFFGKWLLITDNVFVSDGYSYSLLPSQGCCLNVCRLYECCHPLWDFRCFSPVVAGRCCFHGVSHPLALTLFWFCLLQITWAFEGRGLRETLHLGVGVLGCYHSTQCLVVDLCIFSHLLQV